MRPPVFGGRYEYKAEVCRRPKRAFAVRLTPMRPRWIIRPWRILMDMVTLDYFREPGPHSTAKKDKVGLAGAPTDIADLAAWIHGRMLHEHWASRYGEELTPERRELSQRRSVDAVLDGVLAGGDSPRPAAGRAVGVCSHFSLLAVSALRANGCATRSRCGFGTYFAPDKAIDHWVVEVWNGDRWRMVDFQIDDFQR